MDKITPRLISTNSSLFLDTLRLAAALIVAIFHAYIMWFPEKDSTTTPLFNISHAAVVIFFVLSGYVIAYTTTINNRGSLQYAQARLSRLYSVVLPALLITGLTELIIRYADTDLHAMYSRGASLPRYILSGTFLNEIWFFSAAPPMNSPLWSLSYEFWYYIIFGVWFFRSTGWKSTVLLLLACLIAGPKILLMMPIWLAGFAAYRLPKLNISATTSWLFVLLAVCVTIATVVYVPIFPRPIGTPPLFFANQFVTDWVNGFFFAVALWFLPLSTRVVPSGNLITSFRKIADLTFPIYVLHNPLLILSRAIMGYEKNNLAHMWQNLIVVLIAAAIIGVYLEKQRPLWSKFFGKLLGLKTKLKSVYT
ncbi:acyltransferase [Hymenobacter sp.]|jgi:peptidoglycan/LPS O-acetylase OafA/YrhL|uniref:acyltransferase family protein n=1 Tax=Hymenobacter sp. TaxID=1898978 RepID=UPI002ED78953